MIYLLPWILVGLGALAIHIHPVSLALLFSLNVWCLSMPHSFSTYTRHDLRSPRVALKAFFLFSAFFILLNVTMNRIGFVTIYSFYFYWQQFHYTKQNIGIGIWKKQKRSQKELLIDYIFYFSTSILSIAANFSDGGVQFFGYSLINPFSLITFEPHYVIGFNLLILLLYLSQRPKAWKMAITHTIIYSLAYLLLNNFVLGWILLNIFHNSQYLIFMKQEESNLQYLFYAIALTLAIYLVLHLESFFSLTISIMLSLNFTHYIFDTFIWKKKYKINTAT